MGSLLPTKLLLVALGFGVLMAVGGVRAQNKRLSELKDLFAAAKSLESAGYHLADQSATNPDQLRQRRQERNKALFMFAREPKGVAVANGYMRLLKQIADYKAKALQYIDETRKQNGNWFTKVITFGGPLGSMKGLSKSDEYLSQLTERYESLAKARSLSESLVEQDLAKYQIRGLDMILFVLSTDIKYLIIENEQLINGAIYQQLKADRFVATNNFYDIKELSKFQLELLRDFYLSLINRDQVTIGEAAEHLRSPSSLVIGRLFESCDRVATYRAEWTKLLEVCGPECSPSNAGQAFSTDEYQPKRYDSLATLCKHFLDNI